MTVTLTLLKSSDIFTVFTRAFFDWVYDKQFTVKKGGTAFIISVLSRLLSDNIPMFGIQTFSVKNQVVVGLLNGMVAVVQKKRFLRSVSIGVQTDLLAEYLITFVGTVFEGLKKERFDGITFDVPIVFKSFHI